MVYLYTIIAIVMYFMFIDMMDDDDDEGGGRMIPAYQESNR